MRPATWLALVAVVTAACARGPDGAAVASRSGPARPAAAGDAPPRVTALRMGTSGDYPPLSLWPDDRRAPAGFAPELMDAFAKDASVSLSWARFSWPTLMPDLRAGRFDVVADGITVRPERSIAGVFTVPIARGGAVLLLRRPAWASPAPEEPERALAALDRPELRVVVNRGAHLERVTRARLPHADVRAIADNGGVREAFARGEADAAMTNTFEAPRWAAGLAGVEPIGPLTRDVTALWVAPDHAELALRLDAWLLDEEESGHLAELRARTLGPGAGPRVATPVSALLAAISERLALMPLVAAAKEGAGIAVEDTAQEERVLAAAWQAVERAAAGPPSGEVRRAAPKRALVDAFFRAQIELAKAVQRGGTSSPSAEPAPSLERELRPAIARITARMALLLVRLPPSIRAEDVGAEAEVALADHHLAPPLVQRVVASVVALGAGAP